MKTTLLASLGVLALSVLTLQSCDKVKDSLKKQYATDINWDGADVTFDMAPASDTTTAINAGSASFTYNLDSLIKDKTSGYLGIGDISNFYITSAYVTLSNPDGTNNFQNFQLAGLYFNTSVNTTTYAIEIPNNPNTYAATLTLPVDATKDLKSYVNGTGAISFNYVLGGKLRTATTTTLHATAHVSYKFHVGE
jgi:hypothetical protein